jgi:hypothetical protein
MIKNIMNGNFEDAGIPCYFYLLKGMTYPIHPFPIFPDNLNMNFRPVITEFNNSGVYPKST